MFRVSEDQIDQLSQSMRGKFVEQSLAFLNQRQPDWCAEKSEPEVRSFIDSITEFAKERNIEKPANVQRLMILKIDPGFDGEADGFAAMQLTQPGVSETRRVEEFAQALKRDDQPIRISLDTDLSKLDF